MEYDDEIKLALELENALFLDQFSDEQFSRIFTLISKCNLKFSPHYSTHLIKILINQRGDSNNVQKLNQFIISSFPQSVIDISLAYVAEIVIKTSELHDIIDRDDIDSLRALASSPKFDINFFYSKPGNQQINSITPICYSVLQNASKCFQFFLSSGANLKIDPNLVMEGGSKNNPYRRLSPGHFAASTGSITFLKNILEVDKNGLEGILPIALYYHQNKVFKWAVESLGMKITFDCIDFSILSWNLNGLILIIKSLDESFDLFEKKGLFQILITSKNFLFIRLLSKHNILNSNFPQLIHPQKGSEALSTLYDRLYLRHSNLLHFFCIKELHNACLFLIEPRFISWASSSLDNSSLGVFAHWIAQNISPVKNFIDFVIFHPKVDPIFQIKNINDKSEINLFSILLFEELIKINENKQELINKIDSSGLTLLNWVCLRYKVDPRLSLQFAKLLVKNGADPNLGKFNSLLIALETETDPFKDNLVWLLINSGADLNCTRTFRQEKSDFFEDTITILNTTIRYNPNYLLKPLSILMKNNWIRNCTELMEKLATKEALENGDGLQFYMNYKFSNHDINHFGANGQKNSQHQEFSLSKLIMLGSNLNSLNGTYLFFQLFSKSSFELAHYFINFSNFDLYFNQIVNENQLNMIDFFTVFFKSQSCIYFELFQKLIQGKFTQEQLDQGLGLFILSSRHLYSHVKYLISLGSNCNSEEGHKSLINSIELDDETMVELFLFANEDQSKRAQGNSEIAYFYYFKHLQQFLNSANEIRIKMKEKAKHQLAGPPITIEEKKIENDPDNDPTYPYKYLKIPLALIFKKHNCSKNLKIVQAFIPPNFNQTLFQSFLKETKNDEILSTFLTFLYMNNFLPHELKVFQGDSSNTSFDAKCEDKKRNRWIRGFLNKFLENLVINQIDNVPLIFSYLVKFEFDYDLKSKAILYFVQNKGINPYSGLKHTTDPKVIRYLNQIAASSGDLLKSIESIHQAQNDLIFSPSLKIYQALHSIYSENYQVGIRLLERVFSDFHSKRAGILLGSLYRDGFGVDKDTQKAKFYFKSTLPDDQKSLFVMKEFKDGIYYLQKLENQNRELIECSTINNGIQRILQEVFMCLTCFDPSFQYYICEGCANKCHKGHRVLSIGWSYFQCGCMDTPNFLSKNFGPFSCDEPNVSEPLELNKLTQMLSKNRNNNSMCKMENLPKQCESQNDYYPKTVEHGSEVAIPIKKCLDCGKNVCRSCLQLCHKNHNIEIQMYRGKCNCTPCKCECH